MTSEIQVSPVTGMTPAKIAIELRSLIRDGVWSQAKEIVRAAGGGKKKPPVDYPEYIRNSVEAQRTEIAEIGAILASARKEATLRKPTITKLRLDEIQARLDLLMGRGYDIAHYAQAIAGSSPASPSADITARTQDLLVMCERAYALVQALPTIDNATVGREATTIRAIAAILKVHHGLEVEGTLEKLPEMMPALLEAIKKPPDPIPPPSLPVKEPLKEAEVPSVFKVTTLVQLPWVILGVYDVPVGSFVFEEIQKEQIQHGSQPPGVPVCPPGDWSGGNCSALTALKTLVAIRRKYNDKQFSLADADGVLFVVAPTGKKLDLRHGFGDVLYHLRKEHKNAKIKAGVETWWIPSVSGSTNVTVNTTGV